MKYPTGEDGLAVSPYELGFRVPTPEDYEIRGGVEMHHLYFFKSWYNPEADGYGAWRQVFRNLVTNVVPIVTHEHNAGFAGSLHDTYKPPRQPKDSVMIDVVEHELAENGLIRLHNYRHDSPYKIMPIHQWSSVRRRYRSGTH